MCGLCGLFGVTHWAEISAHQGAFSGENLPSVRSERIARTKLINAVLAPFRISVEDFQASSYVVSSPTGRRFVVQDLSMVWMATETILGEAFDPLDATYLKQLDGGAE